MTRIPLPGSPALDAGSNPVAAVMSLVATFFGTAMKWSPLEEKSSGPNAADMPRFCAVLEYEPTSRGATAYADLAQELIRRGLLR